MVRMAYASTIAGSAVIRGNVRGDTSLEILGRVEGDVGVTGDLTVGPDAVVVGTISGARVIIGGSVEGDVTGTEAVVIADTGRVIGDVLAPRIGVSEGAHVRGSVRTDGNGAAATSSRSAVSRVASEPRTAPAAAVPRPAVSAAPPAPSPIAAVAPPKPAPPLAKKVPPPPVIMAPRPGVRAKKKVARR
jgi:cytoskeletal protein CcmA (bactofilin family)